MLLKFVDRTRTGAFKMARSSLHARMTISVCNFLFNQKIFNAVNKKSCLMNPSKLMSRVAQKNVDSHGEVSENSHFFADEHRGYCRKFMENQKFLPVQWESLEQSLKAMKSENIRSTILTSCRVLKKRDLAIDYCHYIINKGEKLSHVETCLLLRLLANCENDFTKHDKFIKTIFDSYYETVLQLEVIAKDAVKVFCKSNSCFKELLRLYKEGKIHSFVVENLIAAAFDLNKPEVAWEIANENPERFSSSVFESYFKFCVRMAEQKKFSVDIINNLIDFSKTYTVVIKFDRLYEYIDQLTSVLNKNKTNNYLWSFKKCETVNRTLCSSCHYKFKPETLKAEELEELKKNFLKKVMISYNINMKTTPEELETFFIFLEKCRPYDIVIDLLNVFGGLKYKKIFGRKILSIFEEQGMRILFIGKNHFKKFEFYNEVKEKWQVFLTRNDSLDDLFCLYAAMHQGVNTYFCTSDFLRDHAKFFDDFALNALFHKWQISHQYLIDPNLKMLYPRCHSDLPQSSVVLDKNNKVKKYYWHLSYLKQGQCYRVETPAEWICLRAESRAPAKANDYTRKN